MRSIPNPRPRDVLADFLLGGNRKRLIIERSAESDAFSALQLIDALRIGRSTVFETLRVLRDAQALDELRDGRYQLTRKSPLDLRASHPSDGPYEASSRHWPTAAMSRCRGRRGRVRPRRHPNRRPPSR